MPALPHQKLENVSLNVVRVIAAALVVISHVRALMFVDFGDSESSGLLVKSFYLVTSLGHQAVMVFFALSGYWVGGNVVRSLSRGDFTWRRYLTQRLTRLWLVLIPALILTQLLDRIGTGVNGASGIYSGAEGYHTVVPLGGAVQFLGIPETLGNLLFVQSLWVPTLGTNTPLWSLAYELWFYILFPALLLACSSRQPLKRRVIAAVVVVLVSLVAGPKVMLLFPIWVAGAMIAWKKDAITRAFSDARKSAFYAARLITPGLTFAVAAASSYLNERLPGADYIVGFAALMMIAAYAGDVRGPGTPLYRSSQAAHWSYSLYAYHLPIVALIVSFMVPAADQRWQVSPGTVSLGLLVAVIAFLAAYAMSLITEQRKDAALGLVRRVSALGGQSPKKVERPLKADIN